MGKRHLYLVRDRLGRGDTSYDVWTTEPEFHKGSGEWLYGVNSSNNLTRMCASAFEEIMPKKFHLTPGGGPVEIVVMLKSEADARRKRVRELEKMKGKRNGKRK